jgi:hypothetical protein
MVVTEQKDVCAVWFLHDKIYEWSGPGERYKYPCGLKRNGAKTQKTVRWAL